MEYKLGKLSVSCDWIAFTADLGGKEIYRFLDLFGFRMDMFKNMGHGGRGYRDMLRSIDAEITIYYNGGADMGIHCEVKGSAVAVFLDCFRDVAFPLCDTPFGLACEVEDFSDLDNLLMLVYKKILEIGWFTRLDVAVDDYGCNYFTCQEINSILDERDYVAKFRIYEADISRDCQSNVTGYTIYCGARKTSDIFLRIYDKRLEQLHKQPDKVLSDWVRWEFELKDERADSFARCIVEGAFFADCAVSLLNGYMRFIIRDNSNTTRCSTLPKWKEFVQGVKGLRLSVSKKQKSVERSLNWIERQCMPTIAGLCVAEGGSLEFVTKDLAEHYNRLSEKDKAMYQDYLRMSRMEVVENA